MKARSIARELALLGISQLSDHAGSTATGRSSRVGVSRPKATITQQITDKPTAEQLDALLLKALTTLGADAQETIETAEGELQRGERLVLESETRTIEKGEVRNRIQPAIPLVEAAINRVGETQIQDATSTVKTALIGVKKALVPEYLSQLISHEDVRSYAGDLLYSWVRHWREIDIQLNDAMEKWTIRRLARVDRDILRLAMIEIVHLDVPKKVAIDEAVEMAKRYSDEDGYRFINGVLRRTTDKLEEAG